MAGMNRPQFSLRAILWVMLVVALLSGWWVDRTRLSTGLDAERQRRAALEKDLQAQAADVEKYKSDRDRCKSEYLHRVLWGRRLDGFNDALNRKLREDEQRIQQLELEVESLRQAKSNSP